VFKAVVALNLVLICAFVSSSLVDCFGFLFHQQCCKSKSVIEILFMMVQTGLEVVIKNQCLIFKDAISNESWYFHVLNRIVKKNAL